MILLHVELYSDHLKMFNRAEKKTVSLLVRIRMKVYLENLIREASGKGS